MSKDKWEKIVEFSPAYDKRHPNPRKNYGIRSVLFKFVLKKDNKAVQFLFDTDWYLPETVKEYRKQGVANYKSTVSLRGEHDCGVNGWDVGYHSPIPQFEGQNPISKCEYIKGNCYSDGSGLYAQQNQEILIRKGREGVWKFLEKEWNETFNKNGKVMKYKELPNASINLVDFSKSTPHCKRHGAMNKLTKDGIWRCVSTYTWKDDGSLKENNCLAGCQEVKEDV